MAAMSGCAAARTQLLDLDDPNVNRHRLVTVPQIYSGTAINTKFFKAVYLGGIESDDSIYHCCVGPLYFPIDFPLSFILDTLLLPLTIPRQIIYGSLTIQSH